jgi:solute:Na+ symporter, SSS family
MTSSFGALDIAVLLAYLVGVTAWGAWLGRRSTGGTGYFLGNRDLPWGAVSLSIVATETSTLTFLSIPGVAYFGNLGFLQLTLGYLVGRIAVSRILLPAYHRGELNTAYALLEERFGVGVRRFTSAIFMVTRLLADSVRLFATAIPLALLTGWPWSASIAVIGGLTLVYTFLGGIRAVIWVDVLQMGLYLGGAVLTLLLLEARLPGGWEAGLSLAAAQGKLAVLNFTFDPAVTYTFWAGLIGGGFLAMASHGTDQLIVQRLLTCRSLPDAQKALIGSGFAVVLQFSLFLAVGIGLWLFYDARPFESPDVIFATFILEELPAGVTGLLIAGVFAAAMSTLSSSIQALASASAFDFFAPLAGAQGDEARIFRAGRAFTVLWSFLLVGTAILYIPMARDSAAVEVALTIASLVYGALLGAFLLGQTGWVRSPLAVVAGMVLGIAGVTTLWVLASTQVGWPWFVPIGTVLTVGGAVAASRLRAR